MVGIRGGELLQYVKGDLTGFDNRKRKKVSNSRAYGKVPGRAWLFLPFPVLNPVRSLYTGPGS